MWVEEDGHAPGRGSKRVKDFALKSHDLQQPSGSCVVTESLHHISQWLVSARQPAHPILQVGTERVEVVSCCLHIYNFPFECSSFTTLIKRKWSIGVLWVSSCFILVVSHKNKWTYPSILITSPWLCCSIWKTVQLSMSYRQLDWSRSNNKIQSVNNTWISHCQHFACVEQSQ